MTEDKFIHYAQAMVIDPATNKPMPKFAAVSSGNSLAEQKTEIDGVNGVVTFEENIIAIDIYNRDTTNTGIFTVNGIDVTVPAGDAAEFNMAGTPSNVVNVSGSSSYIISRLV